MLRMAPSDDDVPVRDKRLADLRVRDVPAALVYVGLRVVAFGVLAYLTAAVLCGLIFIPIFSRDIPGVTWMLLAGAAVCLVTFALLRLRSHRRRSA
jgi:hypothetical protein